MFAIDYHYYGIISENNDVAVLIQGIPDSLMPALKALLNDFFAEQIAQQAIDDAVAIAENDALDDYWHGMRDAETLNNI